MSDGVEEALDSAVTLQSAALARAGPLSQVPTALGKFSQGLRAIQQLLAERDRGSGIVSGNEITDAMEIAERYLPNDYLPGHETIFRRASSSGTPPSFSQEASASSTAASNSGEAVKERPSSNRPAVCQMVSRSSGGKAGNSARISVVLIALV
jgi:hypothetical protein